jgi:hypothetical protein
MQKSRVISCIERERTSVPKRFHTMCVPILKKKKTTCNNNNFIDLWISLQCIGQFFAHLQERKTVVYSNVVYCPNIVVSWRSGVRQRKLCVRCEGCCSSRWAKNCSIHIKLIQRSIKLLLLHLVGHLHYSPALMVHGQTHIKSNQIKSKRRHTPKRHVCRYTKPVNGRRILP